MLDGEPDNDPVGGEPELAALGRERIGAIPPIVAAALTRLGRTAAHAARRARRRTSPATAKRSIPSSSATVATSCGHAATERRGWRSDSPIPGRSIVINRTLRVPKPISARFASVRLLSPPWHQKTG